MRLRVYTQTCASFRLLAFSFVFFRGASITTANTFVKGFSDNFCSAAHSLSFTELPTTLPCFSPCLVPASNPILGSQTIVKRRLQFAYLAYYDPERATLPDLVWHVQDASYDVLTDQINFTLKRVADAGLLESKLRTVPGVLDAALDEIHAQITIKIIPGAVTLNELRSAVIDAGAQLAATESNSAQSEPIDREAQARQRELRRERTNLLIGIGFTLPLFLLAMTRDLFHDAIMLNPTLETIFGSPVFDWFLLVLAVPVQFYVGRAYHVGAYKALKHFTANMDVLISIGTNVVFFYSVVVLIARLFNVNLGEHVYFETAPSSSRSSKSENISKDAPRAKRALPSRN